MIVEKKDLEKHLNIITKVVSNSGYGIPPVLKSCLVSSSGNGYLSLRATNLEQTYFGSIKGETIGLFNANNGDTGSIGVDVKVLSKILSGISKKKSKVEVKFKEQKLCIDGFEISGLPEDEFPIFPKYSSNWIPIDKLMDSIEQVYLAQSMDTSREAIMGVHLDFESKAIVSTDGHRLHIVSNFLPEMDKKITIPSLAIKVLISAKKNLESKVSFVEKEKDSDKEYMHFKLIDGVLTTALIESPYPNWKEIISWLKPPVGKLTVKTEELLDAITQASKINETVILNFSNSACQLSAFNADGYSITSSPFGCWDGPYGKIGFNPRYLSDAVKSAKTDVIEIRLREKGQTADLDGSNGFQALIMPYRIDDEHDFAIEPSGKSSEEVEELVGAISSNDTDKPAGVIGTSSSNELDESIDTMESNEEILITEESEYALEDYFKPLEIADKENVDSVYKS